MNRDVRMEAWETRKTAFANQWKTGMFKTCCEDPCYCCGALCCPHCVSCSLRKRALRYDMTRYECCNGYFPCSGRCGEQNCPGFCLCLEVCCCFGSSVAVTRWMIQDELRIQNSTCDNCLMGTMLFLQQLACICQMAACILQSAELERLADIISFIAEVLFWSVCACMQTQHKIQLDDRDKGGNTGAGPVVNAPPAIGPPQAAPHAYPGAPPPGYPGAPPPGYPGAQGGYPGAQGGYPGAQGGYPGVQPGYPAPAPMYDRPPQTAGYPGQQGMYR
ncbi:hypothetical protein BSKO_00009 [Bryopsis sp. KO-2023]|nr:hypothetical protein BSKO_00009 [Bryopsis sp. KO-2023]